MKLTPSAAYTKASEGSGTIPRWYVYTRTVTDISLPLSSGTWTDVTDRVEIIPSITTRIEYELGQYATDAVELSLLDVAWWVANVFVPADMTDNTKFIEFKIEMMLNNASDVIPMFFGFVDKLAVRYYEREDSVSVTILTPQDLGFRISSENLTTKYSVSKIDGTNDGIRLLNIPGVYPIKADITSYEMIVGTHTLFYEYDAGIGAQMKLDDGDYVVLAVGNNDLVNKAGDQKLRVYVVSLSDLSHYGADRLEEEVVIVTYPQTIPSQWYERVGIKTLLRRYYEEIGITTVVFDSLVMRTWDNNPRVSFIDNPPEDVTVFGDKTAVACDNAGDSWVAVGNKIYLRDFDNDTYTAKVTLDSGDKVQRIIYNYRTGDHEDLWIVHANGNTIKLTCYEIDTDTKRTTITLTTLGTSTVWYNSCEVVDYNYTGTSYKYAFCFTKAHTGSDQGSFWTVEKSGGSALSQTQRFTNTYTAVAAGYGIEAKFMYVKSGYKIRYQALYDSVPNSGGYEEVQINGSGTFVLSPNIYANANFQWSQYAAFHPGDDAIYYYSGSDHKIRSNPAEPTFSITDHHTFSSDPIDDFGTIFYAGDGKCYFTFHRWDHSKYPIDDDYLYSVSGLGSAVFASNGPYTDFGMLAYNSTKSRVVGLSRNGLYFQHHTTLYFYVARASFPGSTATDALNQVLSAWNLVGTVGGGKKAFVYRRGNESGNASDSGDTLWMKTSHVSDYSVDSFRYPKADLIKVSGLSKANTYDGTSYGVSVLSDKRVMELSSTLIPDELVDDVLYYLYQFFKRDRPVYIVNHETPDFYYEVFDKGQVYLPATKVGTTNYGPIYLVTYRQEGSMTLEVLHDG